MIRTNFNSLKPTVMIHLTQVIIDKDNHLQFLPAIGNLMKNLMTLKIIVKSCTAFTVFFCLPSACTHNLNIFFIELHFEKIDYSFHDFFFPDQQNKHNF